MSSLCYACESERQIEKKKKLPKKCAHLASKTGKVQLSAFNPLAMRGAKKIQNDTPRSKHDSIVYL